MKYKILQIIPVNGYEAELGCRGEENWIEPVHVMALIEQTDEQNSWQRVVPLFVDFDGDLYWPEDRDGDIGHANNIIEFRCIKEK